MADYLPIEKIQNGIIYTKDHRYVKVVEVVPINFMLRSAREQRNIIYSFVSYLKISPVKLQIKVLTRRADINRHLDTVRREMAQEKNEQCRLMQEDYLSFVQQIGAREAVTRRFFLIFEYEPWNNTRRSEQEEEAIQSLQRAREFDVMRLLLQSGGSNLSKEALLSRVWGFDSNAVENSVEVYVGFLRKKLASIGSNVRIESVRRLGYHLEVASSC